MPRAGPSRCSIDGEGAILFCFIFLLFVATGPGTWSADDELLKRYDNDEEPDVRGYVAPGGERKYRAEDFGDTTV